MLTIKMHFLNCCSKSILLVLYMFRKSYVYHHEHCIVHAALCGNFFHPFMQAVWQVGGCAWETYHIRLHEQYSLPDDEHKTFETCRGQEELNYSVNLKSAVCWLTLRQYKHPSRFNTNVPSSGMRFDNRNVSLSLAHIKH